MTVHFTYDNASSAQFNALSPEHSTLRRRFGDSALYLRQRFVGAV